MARVVETYVNLRQVHRPLCMAAMPDGALLVSDITGAIFYCPPDVYSPTETMLIRLTQPFALPEEIMQCAVVLPEEITRRSIIAMVPIEPGNFGKNKVNVLCLTGDGMLKLLLYPAEGVPKLDSGTLWEVTNKKQHSLRLGFKCLSRAGRNGTFYATCFSRSLYLLDQLELVETAGSVSAVRYESQVINYLPEYINPIDRTNTIQVRQINALAWLPNKGLLMVDNQSRIVHLLPKDTQLPTLFAGAHCSGAELELLLHQSPGYRPIDGPAWSVARFASLYDIAVEKDRVYIADDASIRTVAQVEGEDEPRVVTYAGRLVLADPQIVGGGDALRQASFCVPVHITACRNRVYVIEKRGALAEPAIRNIRQLTLVDLVLNVMSLADLMLVYQRVKHFAFSLAPQLLRRMATAEQAADAIWKQLDGGNSSGAFRVDQLNPHIRKKLRTDK